MRKRKLALFVLIEVGYKDKFTAAALEKGLDPSL